MKKIILLLIMLIASNAFFTSTSALAEFTLQSVHKSIKADYVGVAHISQAEFLAIEQSQDVVLFDVRSKAEFDVSHIKNAHHLSPSTSTKDFAKRFGDKLTNKKIIFYCSVGVRSSKMARYLMQLLKSSGASAVYNLEGGIFAYANNGNSLANQTGTTKFVHPFNSRWGQLLNSKEMWRY